MQIHRNAAGVATLIILGDHPLIWVVAQIHPAYSDEMAQRRAIHLLVALAELERGREQREGVRLGAWRTTDPDSVVQEGFWARPDRNAIWGPGTRPAGVVAPPGAGA
ncbi:MAG: hypothetical protein RMJ55_19685, partial [Roseiflexaceae bacterium]|nr:hypothetical protein [Roseiflexaceae bacterium]